MTNQQKEGYDMKKLIIKSIVFIIMLGALNAVIGMIVQGYEPTVATDLALDVAKGNAGAWEEQRMYTRIQNLIYNGKVIFFIILSIAFYWKELGILFSKISTFRLNSILALMLILPLLNGCFKPYKGEENIDVKSYQTAFVIPLEDAGDKQVQVNSVQWYEKKKVHMTRIPVSKRWHQTGYRKWQGQWIPTIRVILVDRTAVNRSWTAESDRGTSTKSEPIWLESKDSIGFSMPFNVTANILEEDTALFLYWYPADDGNPNQSIGNSFSHNMAYILDMEVRNKVQEVATEVCAMYNLNDLREKKNEITQKVKEVVVPYFKKRGINITTIGIAGDMTYRNDKIQTAIDDVFIAQQQEPKETALLDAMENKKERKKRDGIAEANKLREEARGIKAAKIEKGKGTKDAIIEVAEALEKAQNNPLFRKWKKLDVKKAEIDKWAENGGKYPERMPDNMKDFLPNTIE